MHYLNSTSLKELANTSPDTKVVIKYRLSASKPSQNFIPEHLEIISAGKALEKIARIESTTSLYVDSVWVDL